MLILERNRCCKYVFDHPEDQPAERGGHGQDYPAGAVEAAAEKHGGRAEAAPGDDSQAAHIGGDKHLAAADPVKKPVQRNQRRIGRYGEGDQSDGIPVDGQIFIDNLNGKKPAPWAGCAQQRQNQAAGHGTGLAEADAAVPAPIQCSSTPFL